MYEVPQFPRAKVVCVFRRTDEILVSETPDSVKGDTFWGPPGGGIEFGETAAQAAKREMLEELGLHVENVQQIGILENIFEYEGQRGHEILFVLAATFVDKSLYAREAIDGIEGGRAFRLTWEPLRRFANDRRLVPDGLFSLLSR